MHLGYLAADCNRTLRTKCFYELLQRLDQAERRLVEYDGARFILKRGNTALAAFLLRQETLKEKPVTRQSRVNERRHECRSARQALHINTLLHTLAYQHESRVRYARRACIAYKRYRLSRHNTVCHSGRCLMLVELVV